VLLQPGHCADLFGEHVEMGLHEYVPDPVRGLGPGQGLQQVDLCTFDIDLDQVHVAIQ
jgi:hypothetical protein